MKKLTLISAILLTANMLFGQYKIDTSFYSEALGEGKMVDIYIPPGYDENPNLYYPVIYYLHAWGGDQNTMNTMTSWLTYLINDSIIDPVIMVGADNSPGPFGGSFYVCIDIDVWLETCRQQILTESQPGPPYFYNYTGGGSFTKAMFLGCGAVAPDTNSPQTYINPQVVDYFMDENGNFIDSIVAKLQANDVSQLIHQLSPIDSMGIYFGCGTNDHYLLYPGHIALRDTLDSLGLPYKFFSHEGDHSMPGEFKQGALIFLDSLILPPGPYISGIDPVAQEKKLSNLLNFPNPFTYSTTIQYELSKNGYIELIIWNHLGQEVETLFKGNKKAGQHQTLFNASKLPAGIYFCRLHIGNEMVTKKIIKR
jgi:hypothetical protein